MGKIIGICNQKGGTGKTTTAINLSVYLALAGQKTLLIDMDPQGNSTSGVGVEFLESSASIYEVLIEGLSISDVIVNSPWHNLSVISSGISLTGAEIELVSMEEREKRLKQALDQIKDVYEYIIIDAPPSLGLLTVNVFVAIESVIVPIQCEYYALEGMSKLINTIGLIKERMNPTLDIEGILLTMADFRTRLTLQVIDEVKKYFKGKTFNTIIPRNIKLAEAPSYSQPIYYYDSTCIGAKAYMNLAEEILQEKIELLIALHQSEAKREFVPE